MATVVELRNQCKARGLKGYSGKNKAQLEAMLAGTPVPAPNLGTVADLRAECKVMGYKGYSTMNKAELTQYVETGERPAKRQPKPGTVEGLRAWLRNFKGDAAVKGFSSMRKAELEQLVELLMARGYSVAA